LLHSHGSRESLGQNLLFCLAFFVVYPVALLLIGLDNILWVLLFEGGKESVKLFVDQASLFPLRVNLV